MFVSLVLFTFAPSLNRRLPRGAFLFMYPFPLPLSAPLCITLLIMGTGTVLLVWPFTTNRAQKLLKQAIVNVRGQRLNGGRLINDETVST